MPVFKTPITLPAAPTQDLHAATKKYVDDNSGGAGLPAMQDVTYSQLDTLWTGGTMTPERYYRITDFRTVHYTQNGDMSTEITTGALEVLRVRARTATDLYPDAYSESYPADRIEFVMRRTRGDGNPDTTINNCPGFKGWITRRVDPILNIDGPFDWRNCQTKLYSIAATGDQYTGTYQYGSDVNGSTVFKMLNTSGTTGNIYIASQMSWGAIPPVVFTTSSGNIDKVSIGESIDACIFHGTVMDTHIGTCSNANIVGDCIDTRIYGASGVNIKGTVQQCMFYPGLYTLGKNDTTDPLTLVGCMFLGGSNLDDTASPWGGTRAGLVIGTQPQTHQIGNELVWMVKDSYEDTAFIEAASGTQGAYNGTMTLRGNTVELRGVSNGAAATLSLTDFSAITGLASIPSIDASGFNGNLATTDDTLQEISTKVDSLGHPFVTPPSESLEAKGTGLTGTQELDLSSGSVFTGTASGACSWDFINAPEDAWSATLILANGGLGAQTWKVGGSSKTQPTTLKFNGGTVITYTSSGQDVLTIFSPDGGTTLYVGQAYKDAK